MTIFSKTVTIAALSATLLAAGTAMARDIRPHVPVPPGDGGGGGYGPSCVSGGVYGYNLRICKKRYYVSGGGLSCSGRLNHSKNGGGVQVRLKRGKCGSGTDWSADSIRCANNGAGGGFPGRIQGAQCTYFPNAEGRAEGYNSTGVYFN